MRMVGYGGRVGMVVALLLSGVARAEVTREALTPSGAKVLLQVHAEGVQIYECATASMGGSSWRFREPLATLIQDGKTVGRHFAGPAWEMSDGSMVRGRVVEQAAGVGARDIPWLRLAVIARGGDGALSKVGGVLRTETRGGVVSGPCETVGALRLEPYAAEYLFLEE